MNISKQKSELRKGAILSYFVLAIYALVALLYTPVMIRYFGQQEYGLYSLVYTIVFYLVLLDLGLNSTIVIYTTKYNSEHKDTKKLFGMFRTIYHIISIVSFLIGLIIFFNFGNFFGGSMTQYEIDKAKVLLLILTTNTSLSFLFSLYYPIIIANEKFVFSKTIDILKSMLPSLLMLPLMILGYKSITYAIIISIVNISLLFCNYLYCHFKLNIRLESNSIDKKLINEIMSYTLFIFLNTVIDKINWGIDQVILGYLYGTIEVSIYALASKFNTMFIGLSSSINELLVPKITKLVTNKENANEIFIRVSRLQLMILFLMLSGFIMFGKDFVLYWVGKEYLNSYYIIVILMSSGIIPLTQNSGISILRAKNKHKIVALIYFLIAIFNIIISVPLARIYQGIGCALGTAFSIIIGHVFIDIYFYRNNVDIVSYLKNMVIILLKYSLLILVFIPLLCIKISSLTKLILFIPLYIILYVIYTYKFIFNDYEKSLIKKKTNK